MEMINSQRSPDSLTQPLRLLGFDMLRALVSARQAACPTVQALTHAVASPAHASGEHQMHAMVLLSGRAAAIAASGTGAFADHDFGGRTFANKGESHA